MLHLKEALPEEQIISSLYVPGVFQITGYTRSPLIDSMLAFSPGAVQCPLGSISAKTADFLKLQALWRWCGQGAVLAFWGRLLLLGLRQA